MSDSFSPFQALLDTRELADLGPGPRAGVLSADDVNKRLAKLFRASPLPSRNQELIRALTLLWHDQLEAAHVISQDIEGPDGAFVHGIMHRREPDFGNAAYWFCRVGNHPSFPSIAARAVSVQDFGSNSSLQSKLCPKGLWDPFVFIQLCEQASRSSSRSQMVLLQQLQALESSILVDHFARGA